MTKTDIGIYRGLKEKFDPEVHVGFFITTDTGELLLGDQSLGQTISGWEINDGVLTLKLNTGKDIRVTFPEATETVKGLLSAADKAQLNALQANLDSKVDKVTGKSLLADSEIEKLAGLPNSTELTNSIATAKAAGDNAQSDLNAHKQNKSNPHEVTKAQVGLGNVTNDAQVKRSEMGVANGVATLDADGKVPASQLPSYVDDIIDVYATYSKSDTGVLSNVTLYLDAAHTQLVTGEAGKIYQNIADGEPQYQFRWTGTIFSQTGASSLILGEVTGTAYDGAKGKANADNIAKIKGTSLSHIKDVAPVTTAADKVSINYECYEGNQYGAAGTDHTADIPAATTAKAGVMSATDKTKLEDLNSKLVVADEEDVTAIEGKIKFKDRDTTNGMGYKILRLPENGILTQDMINQDNTIYEIRYNFDLNGATINIPENGTLKFEGGKLSNGSINGNKTRINSDPIAIFGEDLVFEGTFEMDYCYPQWFQNSTRDQSINISKALSLYPIVKFLPGEYIIDTPIELPQFFKFIGSGGYALDNNKTTFTCNTSSEYVFNSEKCYNSSIEGIKFSDNTESSKRLLFKGIYSTITIRNCIFFKFKGVFDRIWECSVIENNQFYSISNAVIHFCSDSFIRNNYIGGRLYEYSVVCDNNLSGTSFTGNFVDYFLKVFDNANLSDSIIVNNIFDRAHTFIEGSCVNCTVSGNTLGNISASIIDNNSLQSTSDPIKQVLSTPFGIFAGKNNTDSIAINNVVFDNIYRNIDNLFQQDFPYYPIAGLNIKNGLFNIKNIQFAYQITGNTSNGITCDGSNIKIEALLGREVESFPDPIRSTQKKLQTFEGDIVKYKGDLYINHNQKWELYLSTKDTSGPSTNRPLLLEEHKGFEYFDTTLSRLIYWDGTKWIDPAEDSIKWRTIE